MLFPVLFSLCRSIISRVSRVIQAAYAALDFACSNRADARASDFMKGGGNMPRKKSFERFCEVFENQMHLIQMVEFEVCDGNRTLSEAVERAYERTRILVYETYLFKDLYNRFEAPTPEGIERYFSSLLKRIDIAPQSVEEAEYLINFYKRV